MSTSAREARRGNPACGIAGDRLVHTALQKKDAGYLSLAAPSPVRDVPDKWADGTKEVRRKKELTQRRRRSQETALSAML